MPNFAMIGDVGVGMQTPHLYTFVTSLDLPYPLISLPLPSITLLYCHSSLRFRLLPIFSWMGWVSTACCRFCSSFGVA